MDDVAKFLLVSVFLITGSFAQSSDVLKRYVQFNAKDIVTVVRIEPSTTYLEVKDRKFTIVDEEGTTFQKLSEAVGTVMPLRLVGNFTEIKD